MRTILISRHHEWREKVIYHPAPSHKIERHPGIIVCMDCGHEKRAGQRSYVPCHRKGEMESSGYSGVLVDQSTGLYLGRFRMAGKHPVTGKPFAQWSMKGETLSKDRDTERCTTFLTENKDRLKWYDRILLPVAIWIYRMFGHGHKPGNGK